MSTNITGDHTIRVRSALGLPVVMEATAMFTDALVEGRIVGTRTFVLEFAEPDGQEFVVTARLRHPSSENPVRAGLTPIYNLMAGLYRAGADVSVAGTLADLLPGHGILTHDPELPRPNDGIRQIFEDNLTEAERTPPVDPAHLAEVFSMLDNLRDFGRRQQDPAFREIFPVLAKDHRDDASYYLTHRSGLGFVVLVENDAVYAHGISHHSPASARLNFDFSDVRPKPARTWGEVWANYSHGGLFKRPGALEILPDEIALVHHISIARYTIDDRASLDDLTDLSFGPGRSRAYPASVWLLIAEGYGGNKEYETAHRCAEQAALLDESPEMNTRAQEEIKRWRDWIAFTEEQATNPRQPTAASEEAPLRPLARLLERLTPSCAAHLKDVCESIQLEHWDAADYHRRVQPLREVRASNGDKLFTLDYRRVTGQTMLDARVSLGALAHLGYRFDVIPPPEILDDLFTIRCGDTVIWGSVESQALILQDNPDVAYSVKA